MDNIIPIKVKIGDRFKCINTYRQSNSYQTIVGNHYVVIGIYRHDHEYYCELESIEDPKHTASFFFTEEWSESAGPHISHHMEMKFDRAKRIIDEFKNRRHINS